MSIHPDKRRRQFLLSAAATCSMLGAACAAPVAYANTDEVTNVIKLRDLYNKDLSFSDLALQAEGTRIDVVGYMAPPLKAESRFFVLTRRPMSVCPFCESDADWPDDILAVYTKRTVKALPFNARMTARGILELGGEKDSELGFYSKVRLTDSNYHRGG